MPRKSKQVEGGMPRAAKIAGSRFHSGGGASPLTSPAFDVWLDRQMKTLLLACSERLATPRWR